MFHCTIFFFYLEQKKKVMLAKNVQNGMGEYISIYWKFNPLKIFYKVGGRSHSHWERERESASNETPESLTIYVKRIVIIKYEDF